ncbi:hypothetical protein ACN27E_13860 [Mycobacterium sp. WMMD1722]|uniref:hypothetical protein n=1 Tax=Mycobacterium sp. WMMD1722 TaxID=3404117 RepID=UPI003BF50518
MGYLDTAKDRAVSVAGSLVNKITGDEAPEAGNGQWVTVACTVVEAEELWRDAHRMSIVLGELGDVQYRDPDVYRWTLHAGPLSTTWESRVHGERDGLRFVGTDGNEIVVTIRVAPHHLGTELGLKTKTPAPDLLSGALAFKVLYRCRALLQTGEVPTIRSNPSARPSAR